MSITSNSYRQYDDLFHDSGNMILLFHEDGTVCERNSSVETQLGYGEGEQIMLQDILRMCIKMEDGRIKLQSHNLWESFETVAYRKNETCFSVTAMIAPMGGDSGCYGICSLHNIEIEKKTSKELKVAQVEAQVIQKERNEFVSNVTHELRTPVNGIMGLIQNLLDTDLDSEQREMAEVIEQCCKNMVEIINNILDFSKLQSGKFVLEKRQFSFYKLMDNIMKLHQPQAESKGLKLFCDIAGDVPDLLVGDELRIGQVLNNFLSNAIKFTKIGKVAVNVSMTDDTDGLVELFFVVIDSGIGIDKKDINKLFKSFSQVDSSVTRKFGGTGLGLSIAKELVEMMGGSINVESERGKGSIFSFSVKAKRSQLDLKESEENNRSTTTEGKVYSDNGQKDSIYILGTPENLKEISLNMERLIICIEMENWERAEGFAQSLKLLTEDDSMGIRRTAFRLQIAVRKKDYENSLKYYEKLQNELIALEK